MDPAAANHPQSARAGNQQVAYDITTVGHYGKRSLIARTRARDNYPAAYGLLDADQGLFPYI